MAERVRLPKAHRLEEFLGRLAEAPPARTFDEAYGQLYRTLNEVEDELSGVPYNPPRSRTDGRLYPPQWDNTRLERPGVRRLRSARRVTFIGDNGAVVIQFIDGGDVMIDKAGRGRAESSSAMTATRQLADFLDFLRRRFPAAQVETEGYGDPSTNAWVNIRLNGLLFVVRWRSGQGFAIWKSSVKSLSTYGEGPDEHFRSYPAARRRIEQLLADAGAGGEGPAPRVAKRAAGG